MERLTKKNKCKLSPGEEIVICKHSENDCNDSCMKITPCKWYKKAIVKLKRYEDLEEQGRLLKLPCKVGDDIYFIPSETNFKLNILSGRSEENRVYHQNVDRITFDKNGWYVECDKDLEYGTGHVLLDTSYKQTWFVSKKEAEAKLKELRGGENDR